MFQKIANVLSIVSFVMVASMTATGVIGYRYLTSENFKSQVMNEILGNVQGMMPKLLDQGLPKVTGAMKILEQQILEAEPESNQPSDTEASTPQEATAPSE